MGIMELKVETTIMGLRVWGLRVQGLGFMV